MNKSITQPRLITRTITVSHWRCLIPEHRHKKEQVAIACIEKIRNRKKSAIPRSHLENLRILRAAVNGATLLAIGKEAGISPGRVGQIIYSTIRGLRLWRLTDDVQDQLGGYEAFTSGGLSSARDHADAWIALIDLLIEAEQKRMPVGSAK